MKPEKVCHKEKGLLKLQPLARQVPKRTLPQMLWHLLSEMA